MTVMKDPLIRLFTVMKDIICIAILLAFWGENSTFEELIVEESDVMLIVTEFTS